MKAHFSQNYQWGQGAGELPGMVPGNATTLN
jgi:hypothetical protein